ncbi:MAG: ribonuclease PH [Bryobacterales bacterium]|nr:ribonuclease PH [Bryobacteraceae bacterium]MDW8131384.1 ribonuclease PH [Bryobacterales bacterium]
MLRADQRGFDQLRPVRLTPGYLLTAEGSVLIEMGNTRVLCAASVDETVPQFLRGTGRGWVTAEYSLLPRATVTRTPREIARGRPSGRTQEIQRLIGRSLRAVTDLEALGERTIILDCDVIQADGGTRAAAITGAFVALALAVNQLASFGVIKTWPIRDYVAAVSVGLIEGQPLLDLTYEEDSRAQVDMNVVMTGSGQFVEIQATAEQAPFGDDQFHALLELARRGLCELLEIQRGQVKLP